MKRSKRKWIIEIKLIKLHETGALVDWQDYRDCRNDVKRELREVEKEYVQNEIKKNQSSSARWKVIRNCIPAKEKSHPAYSTKLS